MSSTSTLSNNDELPTGIKPDETSHQHYRGNSNKPNPQTPNLKSPLDNPAVKAILDARQEYDRSWVLRHVKHSKTRASLEALGEYDPDGDPYYEYRAALHMFMEICHLRKVEENDAPELLKAEGAEWQRFLTECNKAGVGLD